jgi:hypothetical protein
VLWGIPQSIARIDRGSQKEGKDLLNSTFPRGRYLRERSIAILPRSVTVNCIDRAECCR